MSEKSYVPPKGRVLSPYLCCRDASQAIEWYREVFGAELTWVPSSTPKAVSVMPSSRSTVP